MHFFNRLACLTCLSIGLFNLTSGTRATAEPLTVRLASDREFTGDVDAQTDADHLWLRFGGQATVLRRPIAWNRIRQAFYRGESVPLDQLADLATRIQSASSDPFDAVAPATPNRDLADDSQAVQADLVQRSLSPQNRVRTIHVEAQAADWGTGAGRSGIELLVVPTDGAGELLPVRGTIEVELAGVRPAALGALYTQPRGRPYPQLARWSQSLTADDYGPLGASFFLPFPLGNPQQAEDLAPFASVHVRLVAPGHGVYETTLEQVRIRPFRAYQAIGPR